MRSPAWVSGAGKSANGSATGAGSRGTVAIDETAACTTGAEAAAQLEAFIVDACKEDEVVGASVGVGVSLVINKDECACRVCAAADELARADERTRGRGRVGRVTGTDTRSGTPDAISPR